MSSRSRRFPGAVPADSRAAAKIWDDAVGDVIEVGKKAGAVRMVARRLLRKGVLLQRKLVRWRGRRGSNPLAYVGSYILACTSTVFSTNKWTAMDSAGTILDNDKVQ
jgi:hypothetical protein